MDGDLEKELTNEEDEEGSTNEDLEKEVKWKLGDRMLKLSTTQP